jgi:hypothetical protein
VINLEGAVHVNVFALSIIRRQNRTGVQNIRNNDGTLAIVNIPPRNARHIIINSSCPFASHTPRRELHAPAP